MQILFTALDEVSEELLGSSLSAATLLLGSTANRVLNITLLIGRENVWNFACVQNVVDVFQEAFLLNTIVRKDKACGFAFTTRSSEECLQVLSELDLCINLLDFNLVYLKVAHLCSEASQRLSARATDTHEECVAARLLQDSPDPQ